MLTLQSLRGDAFSWKTGLSLAAASNVSYEPESVLKNVVVNGWGFDSVDFLDVLDTQGFVAKAGDIILISFRGTESLPDWLSNLDVFKEDWPPQGTVHRGFLECYREVRTRLMAAVGSPIPAHKVWLTGHSLGGALATLAAADPDTPFTVAGVYTFGQPRLGDARLQRTIGARLPNRFFRFVNNDDVVPRVPPGFGHVGKLIHFNEQGRVQEADSEAEVAKAEPPPMSPLEFETMQKEIKQVKSSLQSRGLSGQEAVFEASVEGLFPSVSDHSLSRYIAAIRRYALGGSTDSVLEGREAQSVFDTTVEVRTRSMRKPRKTEEETFPVLIRLKEPNWQPPGEIKVNTHIGVIASAQVSSRGLKILEDDPLVFSIEASREAGKQELAGSVPFVGGDVVHRPPLAERGDSVIVGIIDTGVDILHEAFRDARGQSRILGYWVQQDPTGPTPKTVAPHAFTQDYGTLYTAGDIAGFVAADAAPAALRDPKLHGTHVASIAAGSAVGALANGMAPDAKILVVAPYMKTAPQDPPSLGYSNSHVDALAFLKAAAQGTNPILADAMPMAVNVSLGMNAGAHDGTSTLEAAFDAISGGGQHPGFVIVKSAGNERGFGGHARIRAYPGVETIRWDSSADPDAHRYQDYFEVWYSSLDDLEFTLLDPNDNPTATVSNANPVVSQDLNGNVCQLRLTRFHPDNGANRLVITIVESDEPIQPGTWTLRVEGKFIGSQDGCVDMWVERDGSRAVRFRGEEQKVTLSIPGTATTVITVGACGSGMPVVLTPSSSYGRTRDNRPKPDICAPGTDIVAAGANRADRQATVQMTGTSMAAPHVTGALALVLSHRQKDTTRPMPNARQMQAALVRSAMNFSHIHHEGSGFGALDAAGLYNLL